MKLIEKVFGTHSDRELKMIYPVVAKIEALRPKMMEMTDEELKDNTRIFKERLGISCRRHLPLSGRRQEEF